jgi:hypothetical protein
MTHCRGQLLSVVCLLAHRVAYLGNGQSYAFGCSSDNSYLVGKTRGSLHGVGLLVGTCTTAKAGTRQVCSCVQPWEAGGEQKVYSSRFRYLQLLHRSTGVCDLMT